MKAVVYVCLFVWVLWDIPTFLGYLMPNLFLYKYTILFQTIQFSISIVFVKTVLLQTIQV